MTINDEGLYDIYSLWHVPFWQTTWFFWLSISIAIISILCIGCFVWYFFFYKKEHKSLMYWEQALVDLAVIQKNIFDQSLTIDSAYTRIISIIKYYLQKKYLVDSIGKTDYELIAIIHTLSIDMTFIPELERILQEGSVIKFYPSCLSSEYIDKDIHIVRNFIVADCQSLEHINDK